MKAAKAAILNTSPEPRGITTQPDELYVCTVVWVSVATSMYSTTEKASPKAEGGGVICSVIPHSPRGLRLSRRRASSRGTQGCHKAGKCKLTRGLAAIVAVLWERELPNSAPCPELTARVARVAAAGRVIRRAEQPREPLRHCYSSVRGDRTRLHGIRAQPSVHDPAAVHAQTAAARAQNGRDVWNQTTRRDF